MSVKIIVQTVLSLLIGLGLALIVLIHMIWTWIKKPATFRYNKKRTEPPKCLNDPSLGKHDFAYLEDVRLHYVANGDPGKPLMLFVHGFPEFWYSWRHQLREFSKDYRVVAFDQRGYNESDKPSGIDNYTTTKLSNDIRQLIPALGYDSCILVGHDWGGVVAWHFASHYGSMVDKLIIMNAPHPGIMEDYLRTHFSQVKKSWYFFFFQVPLIPELAFWNNDMKILEVMYGGKISGLKTGKVNPEDIEAYKYNFSHRGVKTCSVNYYRAAMRYEPTPEDTSVLEMPVLVIWGEQDSALEKEMVPACSKYIKNMVSKYIPEASHWVQVDTPEKVNQHMHEFLSSPSRKEE